MLRLPRKERSVLHKAGQKEIKASMTFSSSACLARTPKGPANRRNVKKKKTYSTDIIRILPYLAGGTSDSASEYA